MRAAIACLIVLTCFITPQTAEAQSRICRQLMEMARGGGADARDLRRDLRQTIKAAEQRRCLGFFFRNRDRTCRALSARIDRLEHAVARGTLKPRLSDRQLHREMSRHGCVEQSRPQEAKRAADKESAVEGYRTVCVRKCDGYFFPLANRRGKGGFKLDQKVCQAHYGEAAAELYYYPSDETINAARSLSGKAYKDQSFALLYQREFRPECQAQLQAGMSRVKDTFLAASAKRRFKQFALIPIPVPRPSSDEEVKTATASFQADAPEISRVIDGFEPYLPDEAPLAFSGDERLERQRDFVDELMSALVQ